MDDFALPPSGDQSTCRICRSEGGADEPLFHPCKCSGSIKFVHQECLMGWLSHSHKKHCELCKTPFRFTKLYDANMPPVLPWRVFIRRAFVHSGLAIASATRALLVAAVWMVTLPWLIRWAWRWMFWFTDAGWARDIFLQKMRDEDWAAQGRTNMTTWSSQEVTRRLQEARASDNETARRVAYNMAMDVLSAISLNFSQNATRSDPPPSWPQPDTSIFSSWTYLSQLTPHPRINRVLLDIFEGQLITCVVVLGFILVFLIREWVVQQQPLVNLEQLNNVRDQINEVNNGHREETERFRRQNELLDQARRTLVQLQAEDGVNVDNVQFVGMEILGQMMDHATDILREGDKNGFRLCARPVCLQIRAGRNHLEDVRSLLDHINTKLMALTAEEREYWEATLVEEISRAWRSQPQTEASESESSITRRPRMPDRESSSRATQIQRFIEEAEAAFMTHERSATQGEDAAAVDTTADGNISAEISSGASWQHATTSGRARYSAEHEGESEFDLQKDELPITNAGPDAKINIQRSGKGKARAGPEPKHDDRPLITVDDLQKRLDAISQPDPIAEGLATSQASVESSKPSNNNPFHPEGAEPEQATDEAQTTLFRSKTGEELTMGETGTDEGTGEIVSGPEVETITDSEDAPVEDPEPRPQEPQVKTAFDKLTDWFWDDIEVTDGDETAAVPAAEERLLEGDVADQAPFVPVDHDNAAVADPLPAVQHQGHDPDVLAAAAQAGLDAEAVEDAEDLEGIFELIGFQGPLIGLFQTSMFCLVLVTGTVLGAVGLPYTWGKLVLSFIGSPMYFLITLPLQIASFAADLVIDATLFLGGWIVTGCALATEMLLAILQTACPRLESFESLVAKLASAALAEAGASGARLRNMFFAAAIDHMDPLGINAGLLGASVHSHAALKELQYEGDNVLAFFGNVLRNCLEVVVRGRFDEVWKALMKSLAEIPTIPAKLVTGVEALERYLQPVLAAFRGLKSGSITLPVPAANTIIDPSLVYWSSTDRSLAVLAGYLALAMLAAIYVAMDTPITKSSQRQKTEKIIRDTLRQAGGVLKVILIISIEMLVFPLYCGLLLDLAFLPLFANASLASRLAFSTLKPYTFCFVHWFLGTCYMFHFALFVGMCRKILRKGVLWFIRDPDDPTFHPVRDVLERSVTTQLKKLGFAALVYGALVILCLGGVIWGIGRVFEGIFPIHWVETEPFLEFPIDLLLYNTITPLVIRLFKPSDAVHTMYAWWLRRCARVLRLSHFLFDDRRSEEEGHLVHKSWSSFLRMKKPDAAAATAAATAAAVPGNRGFVPLNEAPEVYFQRDGKYVLTPCNDQYRPPKLPGEAFLYSDKEDTYIIDKDGNRLDHFAKIYVPPLFRLRVTLFMVCLWVFSAFTGLCATLVPLVFGRQALIVLVPSLHMSDIYAYSLGAYTLGAVLVIALKGGAGVRKLQQTATAVNMHATLSQAKVWSWQALKCAYVYGFIGLVLPAMLALVLQFYLMVPLHTYIASVAAGTVEAIQSTDGTKSTLANFTAAFAHLNQTGFTGGVADTVSGPRSPVHHSIHTLQDFALGVLYLRIFARFVNSSPTSRAAEAFRRATRDGYLHPDARLATRFMVIPSLLLTALVLFAPPLGAWLVLAASRAAGLVPAAHRVTEVYRYSYPATSVVVVAGLGLKGLGRTTARWRASIRDEVYLVGERLHNFGEMRPPAGSRSVVRRGSAGVT